MKICIAGSRGFDDYDLLKERIDNYRIGSNGDDQIVSGCARGADQLGERYAKEHGLEIISMPADWDKNGRSAGYIRNVEMAKAAHIVVVFWDGVSSGAKHMIKISKAMDKTTIVVEYNQREESIL